MLSTFHFLYFDITFELKVLNSEIHIPMISCLLTPVRLVCPYQESAELIILYNI